MAIDDEMSGYWLCNNNDDDDDNDNLDITLYTHSNACSSINGFLTGLQELNLRLCRIIRLRGSEHEAGVLFVVISSSILNYQSLFCIKLRRYCAYKGESVRMWETTVLAYYVSKRHKQGTEPISKKQQSPASQEIKIKWIIYFVKHNYLTFY
jgi:hypothetical protein